MVEDDFWSDQFGLPIPNGAVNCAVVYKGSLLVGGSFTMIGGNHIPYLAGWNGYGWAPIGADVDGPVSAFLIEGDDLFVGGSFRHIRGQETQGLGKWDGTRWSRVGPGAIVESENFYSILAIRRYHDDLVVGGRFQSTTNPAMRGVARLNGNEWLDFAGGVTGTVRAMEGYHDTLYVAGDLYSPDSTLYRAVFRSDGVGWTDVDSLTGSAWTLAVHADLLYLGGAYLYRDPLGPGFWGLAAWDGSQWTDPLPRSYPSGVTQLYARPGDLVIGNYWGLDIWDGATVTQGPFFAGWPYAIAWDGANLVAGGSFTTGGTPPAFHIGRWNGSQFFHYETWNGSMHGLATEFGGPGYVTGLASYGEQLIVFGEEWIGTKYFGNGSGWEEFPSFPTWTGTTWSSFEPAPPYPGRPSRALAVDDRLYVAGVFYDNGPLQTMHEVLELDGSTWSPLGDLPRNAVHLAHAGGTLHAAIERVPVGDLQYTQTMHSWNETEWSVIGTARGGEIHPYGPIAGLTEFRGELIAFGNYHEIDGTPFPGIAARSGGQWHALGSGPSGCSPGYGGGGAVVFQDQLVLAMGACGCCVYDQGTLQTWDGQSWAIIPGLRGHVTALASIRGLLYVSGSFTVNGDGPRTLAVWDGTSWRSLGSGLGGGALAIVEHDGSIYFGGPFSVAGGKASFGIAQWTRTVPWMSGSAPSLTMAGPNPFLTGADFTFFLSVPRHVLVRVYDVRGREISVLLDEPRPAGVHPLRWNGRDRAGKDVPAGVYFISMDTGQGEKTSKKIVRLK